jgi:segregation and condensation protein B
MTAENTRAIEAILMVAEEPVDPHLLAQLLELPLAQVEELCRTLAESYETEDRGFVLVKVAGGYRFQSHPDLAPYVERFVLDGQSARLSSAALETLAIVAYRQPVTKAAVERIRGVDSDYTIRALLHRRLVVELGRAEAPGRPFLYGTGFEFLERFGLTTLEQLPPLDVDVAARIAEEGGSALAEPVAERVPEGRLVDTAG